MAVRGWHNVARNNKRKKNRNVCNVRKSYVTKKKKREVDAKVNLVLSRYVTVLFPSQKCAMCCSIAHSSHSYKIFRRRSKRLNPHHLVYRLLLHPNV